MVSKSEHKKKASANLLDELNLHDEYLRTHNEQFQTKSRNVFDDFPQFFKSANSNNLVIGESLINSPAPSSNQSTP